MADNSLTVKIGADVTDLQAKTAIAQATLRSFNADLRSLASQYVEAGEAAKAGLLPQLEATASRAAQARAELAGLKAETARTAESGGLAGFAEELNSIKASVLAIGEAYAAAFAVERVGELISSQAEFGDQLVKTAQKTGITVEALSAMRFAANQSDISFEQLTTGIARLSRNMLTAAQSAGSPVARAFQAVGISADFLKTHANDAEGVLLAIADKFAATADGAEKSGIAMELFGRAGADLIPFLDLGSQKIQELGDRAKELGVIMTTEAAQSLVEVRDKTRELDAEWEKLKSTIVVDTAPAIIGAIEGINSAISGARSAQWDALNTSARNLRDTIAEIQKNGPNFFQRLFGTTTDQLLWPFQQQLQVIDGQLEQMRRDAGLLNTRNPNEGLGALPGSAPPSLGQPTGPTTPKSRVGEWRDQLDQQLISERNFFSDSISEELAFWKQKQAIAKSAGGEKLEVDRQVYELEKTEALKAAEIEKKVTDDARNAERAKAEDAISLQKQVLETRKQALADDVADGRVSSEERYRLEANLTRQIYELDRQAVEDQLSLAGLTLTQKQKLNDQLIALQVKFNADIDNLNRQAFNAQTKEWDGIASTVSRSFDGMLQGVLQGTQTFNQALSRMAGNILISWIEADAKRLINWITTEAAMTTASVAGAAARSAAENDTKGPNTHTLGALQSILADAAKAYAGVFAWAAPIIGPFAVVPAAAAFALVAGMEALVPSAAGGWLLPEDSLVSAHQGEMILPAALSSGLQSLVAGGGFAAASVGGGGGQIVAPLNVQTVDARSFMALVNNPDFMRQFAKNLGRFMALNPSTRGDY